ncbi:molybdenum cofactor guanylyltransferase [Aeromicrobium terrae]|uniref:Molybdenum cofactor guanylyltransferase n=1 Tax=Aeromicrobium terrae TaxID=2498846 RepID=A0A5C8NKC1_9ACTN|nr:molybdenum cofactor guanylyltransferase [Aeromicrobium terrae]TXL61546.1 molybdenum cofactor guanylyltransferase [Aeromicrobium terrae]
MLDLSGVAWDAIVLAGGRASRLGGADKMSVEIDGRTLMQRTLDAVSGADRVILVGDVDVPGVTVVQEEPRYAGPVAAVGTGLAEATADWVLVVAGDHPFLADAVEPLLAARSGDGGIAVGPDGRRQNLMVMAATSALRSSLESQDDLVDLPFRTILEPLALTEIAVPERATVDVDTWHDLKKAEGVARDE